MLAKHAVLPDVPVLIQWVAELACDARRAAMAALNQC